MNKSQLILLSMLIISVVTSGWFYYESKVAADERSTFDNFVCPKIVKNPRITRGRELSPFTVDCQCAFSLAKAEMPSEHFSQFLVYAEEAARSGARRVNIPEQDIKESVFEAFHKIDRTCITEEWQ